MKDFQINSSGYFCTAKLLQLQSLIGTLNYACAIVPPGRTFLRRIINLTRACIVLFTIEIWTKKLRLT